MLHRLALILPILCLTVAAMPAQTPTSKTPALTIRGEDFVDAEGNPVRFWGVNLIALYPDHARSDALAANLGSLGVNLVRPHHLLRPSKDWNPEMVSGALVTYKENSRENEPDAWDRFDYLNAALRRNGIYLALSVHFSRLYRPGDVDILKTDDKDREAWSAAMKELNGWHWKKGIDVYKMLPTVDERAALLNEEFIKNLLNHVNPYTGVAYGKDSQVLTLETLNEACTEYAIVCGNRFPDYWQTKLEQKWRAFATAAGIESGDLYKPANAQAVTVRARFLRQLDEDYFERIKKVVRKTDCDVPMMFSNLWEGDNALEMHSRTSDIIENHGYIDPLVVRTFSDGLVNLSKRQVAGKPFFVGEFNQAEGEENIRKQSFARSMLPVAAAAYGSLHNWSGVVWFAWFHGEQLLGEDGWGVQEGRVSQLGNMATDGMMLDHLRTTGIMFRKGLIQKSETPKTLWIEEPYGAGDYHGLMRGKETYQPGWHNISSIRKAFGAAPPEQEDADWINLVPSNPLISDTEQIIKDIGRKQLTVAAPQAEAFSGFLDGQAPAALKHLVLEGTDFATVVLVADDGRNFEETESLIVSRTSLNEKSKETNGPRITVRGLKTPGEGKAWRVKLTRPREAAELIKWFAGSEERPLDLEENGSVVLPEAAWHECELHLRRP